MGKRDVAKVYAVKHGRNVGLFNTWDEVKRSVYGFPGALHKSFLTRELAEEWLSDRAAAGGSAGPSLAAQPRQPQRSPSQQKPTQRGGGVAKRKLAPAATVPRAPAAAPRARPVAPGTLPAQPAAAASSPEQQDEGELKAVRVLSELGRGVSLAFGQLLREAPYLSTLQQGYCMSFDGGSRGNPGLAGAAAVLQDSQGRELAVLQASLPFGCTNNEAEYAGLCMGLMGLQYLSAAGRVCRIVGDSQLVIRQVKGEYACRKPNLRPLHEEATFLLGQLAVDSARVQHVLRNANARADELANEAIDARPAPRIDCVYVCARQGA